ncbi:unnamed protein product [Acanthosepion pharaonis]|uniref:Uncharacterized protein n=1 Tax=Acanthosepion pharaonis TaxID=158019 RepID=A0A812C4W0_ACAPH|nr:unnamed protein product [Sepia pharaonis]
MKIRKQAGDARLKILPPRLAIFSFAFTHVSSSLSCLFTVSLLPFSCSFSLSFSLSLSHPMSSYFISHSHFLFLAIDLSYRLWLSPNSSSQLLLNYLSLSHLPLLPLFLVSSSLPKISPFPLFFPRLSRSFLIFFLLFLSLFPFSLFCHIVASSFLPLIFAPSLTFSLTLFSISLVLNFPCFSLITLSYSLLFFLYRLILFVFVSFSFSVRLLSFIFLSLSLSLFFLTFHLPTFLDLECPFFLVLLPRSIPTVFHLFLFPSFYYNQLSICLSSLLFSSPL